MGLALLRDFRSALGVFADAETEIDLQEAARKLYLCRLAVMEGMGAAERAAPWPALLRMMLVCAEAAIDAKVAGERRVILKNVARALLAAWEADLGDIEGPQAPPAPIRQYTEG